MYWQGGHVGHGVCSKPKYFYDSKFTSTFLYLTSPVSSKCTSLKKGTEVTSTGNEHPALSSPNKNMAMLSSRLSNCGHQVKHVYWRSTKIHLNLRGRQTRQSKRRCQVQPELCTDQHNTYEKKPNSTNIHITKIRLSQSQNCSLILGLSINWSKQYFKATLLSKRCKFTLRARYGI